MALCELNRRLNALLDDELHDWLGMELRATTARIRRQAGEDKTPISLDDAKKNAAYKAVDDYVKSGMVVGLGTGSTASHAASRIAQHIKAKSLKDITCIPTSRSTERMATELQLTVCTLDTLQKNHPDEPLPIDVAIDGADAVDGFLNLIKGGGGALLREKMVESAAKKFVCIVDYTKKCGAFGQGYDAFPLPVEIVQFGWRRTIKEIEKTFKHKNCVAELRKAKGSATVPFTTDNGNYILDLKFEHQLHPKTNAEELKDIVGVVEHGLFVEMAHEVIVGNEDGSCTVYNKANPADW